MSNYLGEYAIDAQVLLEVQTFDRDTAAPTDADTDPAFSIYEDLTDAANTRRW